MLTDLTPFLASTESVIAVVGATDNLEKYGAIIYRDLKSRGYRVLAVNPYRTRGRRGSLLSGSVGPADETGHHRFGRAT